MRTLLLFTVFILCISCNNKSQEKESSTQTKTDSTQVKEREYKVLDSKIIDNPSIWKDLENDVMTFSEEDYKRVKPFVFEKTIPQIQKAIKGDKLTYTDLTLFYLKRIYRYDRENKKSLNSIISLNPNIIEQAKTLDAENQKVDDYSIYGMPILLKDNINTEAMPTTAGATVFQENNTDDAFIVSQLKKNGALILGKANLSEWAYFFCGDCPSGYSAVGGQTLNPYGRKILDTGGSSSGSGVAVAANFAVAAVGSETSGSILSPSSANSVVGLKPTIGLLSRGGIIPISSTLDTPGPMTRSVIDNAILLEAMQEEDPKDPEALSLKAKKIKYATSLKNKKANALLTGKRIGYYKNYMQEDTLYNQAIEELKKSKAKLIALERPDYNLPQFVRLLNLDMKNDLKTYIETYGGDAVKNFDMQMITEYNLQDSLMRMPYGQKLFYGVLNDSATIDEFAAIKDTLQHNGRAFFEEVMQPNSLDAVLSINNYMAGYAAVAKYPALTVPMGYTNNNKPMGLTFIAPTLSEQTLLELAYAYEMLTQERNTPVNYTD